MPFAAVIARSMAGESLLLPLPVAPKSRTLSTAVGPTSAAAGVIPTTARAAEAMTKPRRVLFIGFRSPVIGQPTVRLSRLGQPFAVVAVTRMVLLPAFSDAVIVRAAQVSQSAVGPNDTPLATVLPLIEMSAGRSTVVPLEYRKVNDDDPAVSAGTGQVWDGPTAFSVLQNPVPVKPAWFESMVPWQTPSSASNVPGGGVPPPPA